MHDILKITHAGSKHLYFVVVVFIVFTLAFKNIRKLFHQLFTDVYA